MHLLLTAIGSYGDVHPMIGLAAAMQRRGHEVTLITNPYFLDEAAAAGVPCETVSTVKEYDELTAHRDLWHGRRGVGLIFRWSAERLLRPIYERLDRLYRPGETVIAAHPLDIASRVLAESKGAKVISVVFAPMALWSDAHPPRLSGSPVGPGWPRAWNRAWLWLGEQVVMRQQVRPTLDAVRRGLGLPPIERVFPDWWYSTGHTLGLFPDWFVSADGRLPEDWPTGTEASGFPVWGGARGEQPATLEPALDEWLRGNADRPPVVATPGTANRAAASFFHQMIDACGRLRRPALLLTKFPEQLPSHLPSWVRHASFVPLSEVLPRAAAFVHHGGIGSCAQGLAAGVPQLIRPLAFDQPDNAARLQRLGVGDQLSPRRFSGAAAAERLHRLIDSRSVGERCAELARRCDGTAARTRACEYFERLAEA